jgi:ABC transporter DrrB family efflux protein
VTATAVTAGSRCGWLMSDSWEMTRRSLLHSVRVPYTIVFTVMQPVVFALLFRYVFGDAFAVSGDYVDFMMPGVFAMTVAFGSITTSIRLADDLNSGAIDRFRSLPMARSAVLVGHTGADLLRSMLALGVVVFVGFLIGFRIGTGWPAFLAGVALTMTLSYALIWLFALVGVLAPNAVTAEVMAFPALLTLTFASSAFVPTEAMPGWLQIFSEHQPITAVVDASRALMLGGPTTEAVLTAVVWIVGVLMVFTPITIHRYRRTA